MLTLPTFKNSLETLLKSNAESRKEARQAYASRAIRHAEYKRIMDGLYHDQGVLLAKVLELATVGK